MDYDYTQEVQIDLDALDREWQKQPTLVAKYGEALAEAKRDQDQAEEELSLISARLDRKYREKLSTTMKKPREADILGHVQSDPEYQTASKTVIDCKYNVNVLKAACSAMSTKTDALNMLGKLWLGQYFSEAQESIIDRGTMNNIRGQKASDLITISPRRKKAPK